MRNLLIVDDEIDILEGLEELFRYESGLDIGVYTAKSGVLALELLSQRTFEVVMTDIKMPGMNGLDFFKKIREKQPKCKVIFLTGYREFDYLYEINHYKDVRYLLKSEEDETLIQNVKEVFEEAAQERMFEEVKEVEKHNELEKIYDYIQHHLNKDLTLAHLAQMSYMNPSYFSRLFKQKTGCNLTEYISDVRLKEAKRLLTTSTVKITEISERVGYKTSPSFHRVFKKATGCSPAEYRKRYGDKNYEI